MARGIQMVEPNTEVTRSAMLVLPFPGAPNRKNPNPAVIASPRVLIPILELYQNKDGTVTIPDALRAYMGGRELIEAR